MKRGLVSWDKSELPPQELAARLATVHALAREEEVDALVLYSDVWRSNDARYLSNYMPYWNRAFVVVPREVALAIARAMAKVPASKGGVSKTPMGPFHITVLAIPIARE